MATSLSNQELTNRMSKMQSDLDALTYQVSSLLYLAKRLVNDQQFYTSEKQLRDSISKVSQSVTKVENKLTTISLPGDTRYYLEKSEIDDFRTNFQKLIAMISDVENLYKSTVSYVTNLK